MQVSNTINYSQKITTQKSVATPAIVKKDITTKIVLFVSMLSCLALAVNI